MADVFGQTRHDGLELSLPLKVGTKSESYAEARAREGTLISRYEKPGV